MDYKVGDLVTRNSYGNDIIFKIIEIGDIVKLKGVNMRLLADALVEDLKKYQNEDIENEKSFLDRI
ncbi:MAG: hypothetical protein IJ093_00280 [Bacilli bacterium]|nr:hypothetical protein [Bacilli bacterium]